MITENHNHRVTHSGQDANQPVRKTFSPIIQQGLGTPHATRRTCGENDPCHYLRRALRSSCAKMDLESDRQSESGERRTAIISATTETAISSGDSAPISRPMGANTRS